MSCRTCRVRGTGFALTWRPCVRGGGVPSEQAWRPSGLLSRWPAAGVPATRPTELPTFAASSSDGGGHRGRRGRGALPDGCEAAHGRPIERAVSCPGCRHRPVHTGHPEPSVAAPSGSPAGTRQGRRTGPGPPLLLLNAALHQPGRRAAAWRRNATSRTGSIGTCRSARPGRYWWSAVARPCCRWSTARPRSP